MTLSTEFLRRIHLEKRVILAEFDSTYHITKKISPFERLLALLFGEENHQTTTPTTKQPEEPWSYPLTMPSAHAADHGHSTLLHSVDDDQSVEGGNAVGSAMIMGDDDDEYNRATSPLQ